MRADKSLSPFEIRVYRHYRIVHGTRVALAFLLTFLIIRLFTIPESTAAGHHGGDYGANLVLGNVVPRAFERIGGTVLGSILGLIALQLELISLPLMLVWCAAAMFLCGWLALGKKPYQGLLIGVTLAIVVGSPTGEIDTALWRSGDVILGSLLAMLFTGIWPQRAFIHWRIQLAKSLTEYNRLSICILTELTRTPTSGKPSTKTPDRCRENAWADCARQQRNPYSQIDI